MLNFNQKLNLVKVAYTADFQNYLNAAGAGESYEPTRMAGDFNKKLESLAAVGPQIDPGLRSYRDMVAAAEPYMNPLIEKIKSFMPAPAPEGGDPEKALQLMGLGGAGIGLSALLGKRIGAINKAKQIEKMLQAAAPVAQAAPAVQPSILKLLAGRGRGMMNAAMGAL